MTGSANQATLRELAARWLKEGKSAGHSAYDNGYNAALGACAGELEGILVQAEAQAVSGEPSDEWWKEESLDVIRHARTNEPHDSWEDWRNAVINGLLRAFNRGAAAPKGNAR